MKNKLFYVIVSIVLAITTTLSVMSWFKCNKSENVYPEYSYAYDCIKEAELNYHKTKALLCDAVQKYISETAPTSNLRGYAIVEECERYNIDIIFTLVQGEIESHFGTKGLGAKINNVFNVGVFDNKTIAEIDEEYKPEHPNASIKLYLDLLTESYLVGKDEFELMNKYVDKNGKRYASNPNYEEMFKYKYNIIENSTNIKQLQGEMKNYALKCNR
jgi:hypothetical protein